jgi:hypothetical protein
MPDALTIHLDGKPYSIDDFELGELEWLEDELGDTLDQINWNSMKAATRFVYLIKRRDDPDFTLDDARKIKLQAFNEPEPEPEKPKRPTRAAKAATSG